MKSLRSIGFAASFVLLAAPLAAQSADANRAGFTRQNLVSANPIGLLFQWFNGEYEHAFKPTASLAFAVTSFDLDDARYTAADAIVRYYPAARAIRGFSIGASAGFVNIDDDCDTCNDPGSAFTLGVRGDYVWILGRDQRFAVATGIGAKRLFTNDADVEGLPIGRLSIGYAW